MHQDAKQAHFFLYPKISGGGGGWGRRKKKCFACESVVKSVDCWIYLLPSPIFVLILLYWLDAFFSSPSTVLLCVGHVHPSPSLFSRKFIPPFSMLLIGLIALLVKCWDLLLQSFETAPCNVYLPDMAEIICFHNTWGPAAAQQLAGMRCSGFGLVGWVGYISKVGSEWESSKDPEGGGCPTPVEIIIESWNHWGWKGP